MDLLQDNRKQSLDHLFLNWDFTQNAPRHFVIITRLLLGPLSNPQRDSHFDLL